MLIDLPIYNDTPILSFKKDEQFHQSFIVSAIKTTDTGVTDDGYKVLFVEKDKSDTIMSLVDTDTYRQHVEQTDFLDGDAIIRVKNILGMICGCNTCPRRDTCN